MNAGMDIQNFKFLDEIAERGIHVVINGKEYFYDEMNYIKSVLEDENYMKDYISNSKGIICQINLDKVKEI